MQNLGEISNVENDPKKLTDYIYIILYPDLHFVICILLSVK